MRINFEERRFRRGCEGTFWLNRDPIGIAGGLNLYAYVGNNPISGIDPLGLVQPLDPSSVKALRPYFQNYDSSHLDSVPTSELQKAMQNARDAAKRFDDDINSGGGGCDKNYDVAKHRDLQNKRADELQKVLDQRAKQANFDRYLDGGGQFFVTPGLINPSIPMPAPVADPLILADPIFVM